MVKYAYSTSFAGIVFDNQFNVVEKAVFKDPARTAALLEQGKDAEETVKLAQKHHADIVKKPSETLMLKLREFTKDFHDSSLAIAKEKLRHAFGSDMLLIQAINSVDELNKAANMLSKRLREWFEIYCPEFSKSIEDHEKFSELVAKKTRDELLAEIREKETIGTNLSKDDLRPILDFARNINELYRFKSVQENYIEKVMLKDFANINAITGSLIGAKLIALASGIKRLSEFPASTVQLLGAEKALFRHIKNRKYRSPKYGVLMQHPLISQARKENKAKIARLLGDKVSIASKVDYFKGKFVGNELMEQIRKKVKHIESSKPKEDMFKAREEKREGFAEVPVEKKIPSKENIKTSESTRPTQHSKPAGQAAQAKKSFEDYVNERNNNASNGSNDRRSGNRGNNYQRNRR